MFLNSVVDAIVALAGLTAGLLVLFRVITPRDAQMAFRKAMFVTMIAVFILHLISCLIHQAVIPALVGVWNVLKSVASFGALALFLLIAGFIIGALRRKQRGKPSPACEEGFDAHTKENRF